MIVPSAARPSVPPTGRLCKVCPLETSRGDCCRDQTYQGKVVCTGASEVVHGQGGTFVCSESSFLARGARSDCTTGATPDATDTEWSPGAEGDPEGYPFTHPLTHNQPPSHPQSPFGLSVRLSVGGSHHAQLVRASNILPLLAISGRIRLRQEGTSRRMLDATDRPTYTPKTTCMRRAHMLGRCGADRFDGFSIAGGALSALFLSLHPPNRCPNIDQMLQGLSAVRRPRLDEPLAIASRAPLHAPFHALHALRALHRPRPSLGYVYLRPTPPPPRPSAHRPVR